MRISDHNLEACGGVGISRRQFLAAAHACLWASALPGCGDPGDRGALVPPIDPTRDAISGLDFPGSAGVEKTMRFRFLNPLDAYPATYIWRCYPRQQAGYYTAFFWANDDGRDTLETFLWTDGRRADTYYGAHPYPAPPPDGSAHQWEISILQTDITNGWVEYDRWYVQALRVWSDIFGKHHEFYWDLPHTDPAHRVTYTAPRSYGNRTPPVPTLTWGDAPWNPGREVWNGVLRGIQIYAADLSLADIISEASTPLSTSNGAASIWYRNPDPTPDDIADKSGRGHHPAWVGPERPRLWLPQVQPLVSALAAPRLCSTSLQARATVSG
jgi:hypothetical protein